MRQKFLFFLRFLLQGNQTFLRFAKHCFCSFNILPVINYSFLSFNFGILGFSFCFCLVVESCLQSLEFGFCLAGFIDMRFLNFKFLRSLLCIGYKQFEFNIFLLLYLLFFI